MKTYRKGMFLSLLLSLAMILGSFSFAFADDTPFKDRKISLTAYPGYNSVTLKWNAVPNADGYEIVVKNSANSQVRTVRKVAGVTSVRDVKANAADVKYYYSIRAYRTIDGRASSDIAEATGWAKASGKAVRQMYEKIYLSRTKTLTSHDKYRTRRTFSSNKALTAVGFGGGCYKFYDGKGKNKRLYYAHYTSVRSAKADYSKKQNYTTTTAENFVNELTQAKVISKGTGKGNRTYLVWVSTYTQHLYIFKWDKKTSQWKLFKLKTSNSNKMKWSHWECATGEAVSPTRIDMRMMIRKKIAYMIGIPYWNCFSGDNGIHGKRDSYVIDGKPHSHGCVRNYNYNAEWIYKNCKVGTQVIIY